MKIIEVVEKMCLNVHRSRVSKHLIVFVFFLAAMLGSGMKLVAQVGVERMLDFSNRVMTTNCCPKEKQILESILNNAPFVFEGRMIKGTSGKSPDALWYYESHLFEVEKVYRGGERLQAGTVEIIVRYSNEGILHGNEVVNLSDKRCIVFAKEIAYSNPNLFEANNSVKLELFYHVGTDFSYIEIWNTYALGMFLSFTPGEEVRNFLASYNLFSTDMPKADTLMTLSARDKENARKKAIQAEEEWLKRQDDCKRAYKYMLETQWKQDSLSGKKTSRKSIDDAIKEFEKAPSSEKERILRNLQMEKERIGDSLWKAEKEHGQLRRGDGDTALILSIQNMQNTGTGSERFLEFDIMGRAEVPGTYFAYMHLFVQYESDTMDRPFKKGIALDTQSVKITRTGAFANNYLIQGIDSNYVNYNNQMFYIYLWNAYSPTFIEVPTTDSPIVHVKMRINDSDMENTTFTFLVGGVPNSFAGFKRDAAGSSSMTPQYILRFEPDTNTIIPLAPKPIISNFYINTSGNTSGCAGCGDVLVVEGKHFGNKNVTNPDDTVSKLAFKLGDFKTNRHDTIPYYQLRENWDYLSWNDTLIEIKLPSLAIKWDDDFISQYDSIYQSQYPGTGPFKVITGYGKEDTSAANIEIKYVLTNWSYMKDAVWIKKLPPIPKRDCFNGFRFQVDAQIAADSAALFCIRKAMNDWMTALDSLLLFELETDAGGKLVVNNNTAWAKDGINTIAYGCQSSATGTVNLMTTVPEIKWCEPSYYGYYSDNDIGVCNATNWYMNPADTVPPQYYSFYSCILHELGHVIGLRHVIDSASLMKTMSVSGTTESLDANSIAGAKRVIDSSMGGSDIYWKLACKESNVEVLNSINPYCNAVLQIKCTTLSSTEIKVEWDSVENATNYYLDYSLDSTFSTLLGSYILPYDSLMKIFHNLIPGAKYYFRIKAGSLSNGLGSGTASGTLNFSNAPNLAGTQTFVLCNSYRYICNIDNPHLYTYQWFCNNLEIVSKRGHTVFVKPLSEGSGNITILVYAQGHLVCTISENVTIIGKSSLIPTAYSNQSINTDTVWKNPNHLLLVTTTIKSGATLTITGSVYGTANAKIVVNPGGKLIVNGGMISTACEDVYWQGIVVDGTNNVSQSNTAQQGIVQLINGAVIKDAACGITVGSGGIVRADNVYFINNKQAVSFNPYNAGLNIAGRRIPNKSYFKNCEFWLDNSATFAQVGEAQVKLNSVVEIPFTNCDFIDERTKTSTNYTMGIYANASSIEIGEYSSHTPSATPKPQAGCSFSGFDKAIYLFASGGNSSRIYSTAFTNNHIGIAAEGVQDFKVENCQFEIPLLKHFSEGSIGIYLRNTSLYNILNNYFEGTDATQSTGVVSENSGEGNHFVQKNTFKNLCTGCLAIGKNAKSQSEGLGYRCNKFESNDKDISIDKKSTIRQIQTGHYDVWAAGNVFFNSNYNIYNQTDTIIYYHFLFSSLAADSIHFPFSMYGKVSPIPKQGHCCEFYGYTEEIYYYPALPLCGHLQIENGIPQCHDAYLIADGIYEDKKPKYQTYYSNIPIEWEDPDVINIVEQLDMLDGDPFTITIDGRDPITDLEKQIVLYYELTNLKQYMDMICYAALEILANDTTGLDMEEYRIWIGRFNTIESDYALADSYINSGEFAQAGFVLNAMSSKFEGLNVKTHQNYWDYLAVRQEFSILGVDEEIPSHLVSELVRLSSYNDVVSIKAYSFGEMLFEGWRETYPRSFEVHPSCICSVDDSNGKGSKQGKGKGKSHKSMEEDEQTQNLLSEKKAEITVKPNPTKGELIVGIAGQARNDVQGIDIYSVVGQNVGANLRVRPENNEISIDVSHLSNGMYFLKIQTENGIVMKKFVKQ